MAIQRLLFGLPLFLATVAPLVTGSVHRRTTLNSRNIWRREVDPATLYPEHNISVPIDYFHNETKYEPHSNDTFPLRYWFDASYYKDGGPVIVLQSGETDGEGRLPFLQKGLLHQLAQATNGIGVVLEHRYYGKSFPTPDLSTPNLRFLTTEQALADMAYFAQNVVFEGLEDKNLTAPETAYFGYGVISSSGVTEAIWDFWQYYEPVRKYGPPDCISTHTKLINVVDNILCSPTPSAAGRAATGTPPSTTLPSPNTAPTSPPPPSSSRSTQPPPTSPTQPPTPPARSSPPAPTPTNPPPSPPPS
ncbi:MAG: hypothetical protein LQ346_007942 [Caloplaca aetnensis]|nr:MAG: hypothetical protein LQ346_007942 [Caloplaca aetnensis]